MAKREYLLRYLIIIKYLQNRIASFDEISDYLDKQSEIQGFDLRISKRTFQRDINEIRSIFNIEIEYEVSRRRYYVNRNNSLEANERILEAFDLFNTLSLSSDLAGYIQFEQRKPKGTEYLYGLLHAIKSKLVIVIKYFKYEGESYPGLNEPLERTLEALLLKEFRGRWYLVALDQYDNRIKTYGLDRIVELEITKKHFSHPMEFNANSYFRNCFGIIRPNEEEPEEVILSFDALQGKYIKSYPLHESQKVISENEEEIRIQLSVFITYDFVMELLQYGDRVKVIKPYVLKRELKDTYSRSLLLY